MMKFLIPALSAAVLTFASVSTASAGAWGAFYPNGAHDHSGDQGPNERSGIGRPKGSGGGNSAGNENSSSSGRGNSGGSYSGGGGSYSGGGGSWSGGSGGGSSGSGGGGGTGISHSAPGPVLGLGLPAFAVAGGYLFFRRRAKKK